MLKAHHPVGLELVRGRTVTQNRCRRPLAAADGLSGRLAAAVGYWLPSGMRTAGRGYTKGQRLIACGPETQWLKRGVGRCGRGLKPLRAGGVSVVPIV